MNNTPEKLTELAMEKIEYLTTEMLEYEIIGRGQFGAQFCQLYDKQIQLINLLIEEVLDVVNGQPAFQFPIPIIHDLNYCKKYFQDLKNAFRFAIRTDTFVFPATVDESDTDETEPDSSTDQQAASSSSSKSKTKNEPEILMPTDTIKMYFNFNDVLQLRIQRIIEWDGIKNYDQGTRWQLMDLLAATQDFSEQLQKLPLFDSDNFQLKRTESMLNQNYRHELGLLDTMNNTAGCSPYSTGKLTSIERIDINSLVFNPTISEPAAAAWRSTKKPGQQPPTAVERVTAAAAKNAAERQVIFNVNANGVVSAKNSIDSNMAIEHSNSGSGSGSVSCDDFFPVDRRHIDDNSPAQQFYLQKYSTNGNLPGIDNDNNGNDDNDADADDDDDDDEIVKNEKDFLPPLISFIPFKFDMVAKNLFTRRFFKNQLKRNEHEFNVRIAKRPIIGKFGKILRRRHSIEFCTTKYLREMAEGKCREVISGGGGGGRSDDAQRQMYYQDQDQGPPHHHLGHQQDDQEDQQQQQQQFGMDTSSDSNCE